METYNLANQSYLKIFHNSPIAMERYDSDGFIKDCNESTLQLFGIDSVKQVKHYNLFNEPNLSTEQKSEIKAGKAVHYEIKYDFESVIKSKCYKPNKKGIVYLDCFVRSVKAGDNEITDYFTYILDVTEKKIAQQNLAKNELQLKDTIAAKDKLFSIIAHDLRSPFNSILGFSDVLSQNIKQYETDEVEKYLKIINTSARNTLVLLTNLLDWAKIQVGQIRFSPEEIVFSDVIKEIMDLNSTMAKAKQISLSYLSTKHLIVFADNEMLKTVLRNLISNAIKHTGVGGKIEISATTKPDCVEFSVSDNGTGMDKEEQNALFNFSAKSTTKSKGNKGGSGLGLIICKDFIERHGGKIWVSSEKGLGSTFCFTLPKN